MTAPAFLRSGAAAALLLVPFLALAQPAPPAANPAPPAAPTVAPPAAAAQPVTPALTGATAAAVTNRIAALKARLGITAAELPLWDAFAQAMRDSAARTDALFTQRASDAAKMSAIENMHSYAAIARAYADTTERLAIAFDILYASFSDIQKRAADTLFRDQVTAQKPAPR